MLIFTFPLERQDLGRRAVHVIGKISSCLDRFPLLCTKKYFD